MAEDDVLDGPSSSSSPLRMLATGSAVVGLRSFSTTRRWIGLGARRSGSILTHLRHAQSGGHRGPAAHAALRDELIGLAREMAEISDQEIRLGLEQFDRHTRPGDAGIEDESIRRHRVKR